MYLNNFHSIVPPYATEHEEGIKWLAKAYELSRDKQTYTEHDYLRMLQRVGCHENQIATRRYFLPDALASEWDEKVIYRIHENPKGMSMHRRHEFYHETVSDLFNQIYQDRTHPDDIIHISCTGYVSPSAAQKVAAKSTKRITVTHSYHMGCYGAFPALRMASGFLSNPSILGNKKSVDLVHTELCSLHLNPQDPSLEQMVIQSLFADGCIAYSMTAEAPPQGFKVHSIYEELIPDSENAMEWMVSDWGMKMSLSKDVPGMVGEVIRDLTCRWLNHRGFDCDHILKKGHFAVHPGGPKIIDQVVKNLGLSDEQVSSSRQLLLERGNMSSATLPHIWEKILHDENIPSGTQIVSYAFGPGLTICASLMEKL